jgi:phosphoglucosamine mutase
MPDNGIKFFDSAGGKLPDATENEVESRLGEAWTRPVGAQVGRISDHDGLDDYVAHLSGTVAHRLDGLHLVVDCAYGAAARAAPKAYAATGARVSALHDRPDGYNINDGVGSTHPEPLARAVAEQGADLGIAHDGDADRCVAVDAAGNLVDGDVILAICALGLHEAGELPGGAVATTVMTNLGFRQAMRRHGISVVETAVGDRYVLEAMRQHGLILGGEQSGHLVFLRHATTGDGILTALQLMSRMAATGRPLADLASVVTRLPQVLLNVTVRDRDAALISPQLAEARARAEAELAGCGRLLVRPSGTEPVIRVMVEAPTAEQANEVAARVAAAVHAD